MSKEVIIFTDGGSRGNPGPSAAGFVIQDTSGNQLIAKGIFLGNNTNNFAEYNGVILSLETALEMGAKKITLYSDSQLMVRQINGQYKVKSPNLKDLYNQARTLLGQFKSWKIEHVYREQNKDADALANKAMDLKDNIEIYPQKTETANSKKLRLAVMLSGGGTTMLNIQKEIDAGNLNAQIITVISSRGDVKGIQRARDIGIEPVVIRRKDFSDIDSFSESIAAILRENKIELAVQAGWLCLWKIPEDFTNKVMNIHPSLLPSFGGKGMWGHHVHEAVLKAGCKVSGCTVHFCTNEYDKGPIIVQKGCVAKASDSVDDLAERVFRQECLAYPEAIRLFAQGKIDIVGEIVHIKG